MVSYIKWSRVTKSGDFLTIEHGVTKEYPFLLEIKVKKMSNSIKENFIVHNSHLFAMFLSSECHNVRVGWIPMFSGKCSWRDVFINSPANKQIWKGEDSLDNIWFNTILCDGRKVSFLMIKIMKTSFLLKMAVAVTPLHSMLTSILSPLTVLLTTVVTPCLRTCDNVTMWHHYIHPILTCQWRSIRGSVSPPES